MTTELLVKNLKRHLKEKLSGNIPHYQITVNQAKKLEKEGYITILLFGDIELTECGERILKAWAHLT